LLEQWYVHWFKNSPLGLVSSIWRKLAAIHHEVI
jgi:hypothetical protein